MLTDSGREIMRSGLAGSWAALTGCGRVPLQSQGQVRSVLARPGRRFVQVEGRVELGLARQQFLQPRLVLEGPLGLGLIVGESFVEPLQLLLLVCGNLSRVRSVCSMLCNSDLLHKERALHPVPS
jgi:hypothetical protein